MNTRISRRRFVSGLAAGGAGLLVLRNSASARSYQANEKLNIALVGLGARGKHFVTAIPRINENLVVLCDVNQKQIDLAAKVHPKASQFRDFRKMFDSKAGQIDAVVIATPVHSHAVVASAAMKLGKHVYVEKPLVHDVAEARALRDLARRQKVATQMGCQGMATDSFRRTLELIQAGAIGDVREAYVLFESGGTGPLARPAEQPVPDTLDWDLWLGPAPARPYHPGYLNPDFPGAGGKPFDNSLLGWNRWRDFGGGALGGAGSHSINLAFKALDAAALWAAGGQPRTIRVETEVSEVCPENFPRCQIVRFDLPARGKLPPARIEWVNAWDTEIKRRGILDRLEKLAGEPLKWAQGSWSPHSFLLLVGTKGRALANFHNSVCRLLPEKDFPDAGGPPQTLPHSGSHEREWVAACKGGPRAMANFEHSAPALELLLLGNVAALCDRPLDYDPLAMRITNNPQANARLTPNYRKGWAL
jgi:hypothetical protein